MNSAQTAVGDLTLNDLVYPEKERHSTTYGTEQLRNLIAR